MVTIAFPGLGIEPFTINKIAFTVPIFGGVEVRWYGLIITFGIILAFMYAWYRSKQERVAIDDLLDIAIYAVIFAVIGARIYYVLFDIIGNGAGDNYRSFIDYIAIWRGGIAIYGAIIGGALSIYVVCKCKKIKWQRVFDMVSPGVMIGQILGRWGNFFNGEAFGGVPQEGTFLYRFRMEVAQDYWYSGVTAHPTFFYESFWNLIGFLIINAIYKKKRFDGEVFLWYITWYGFGRMLVEGLRTDSLWLGRIRISQLVGALCFVVGAWILPGYDGKSAWKIWRRDRHCHKSPNSAQGESACAGALGLRLAGDAWYFGKLVKKPFIGDETRHAEAQDIIRVNRLMMTASFLSLIAGVGGMLWIRGFMAGF